MARPIISVDLMRDVVKSMGIPDDIAIRRIVIDMEVTQPVRVYYDTLGTEQLLSVDWDALVTGENPVRVDEPHPTEGADDAAD